jgi:hypothetical protein
MKYEPTLRAMSFFLYIGRQAKHNRLRARHSISLGHCPYNELLLVLAEREIVPSLITPPEYPHLGLLDSVPFLSWPKLTKESPTLAVLFITDDKLSGMSVP